MGFLDSFKKIFSSREEEDRTALSKKVQVSPQDPQARQKLGIYLLRQGEVVEGLDQLARAAVMYEKDGFASKAIAVLRQMLKNDPGNLEFLRWLIRLLAQEGLAADAQRELEKAGERQGLFATDDQKIEFYRQAGESLPRSPVPALVIADVMRTQRKPYEAAAELEKAASLVVPARMTAEFSDRLVSLAQAAGDNAELLEACGFLWLRIDRRAEGVSLLARVVDKGRDAGDAGRVEAMERVLAAIEEGWNVAAAAATSFDDALHKLQAPPPPAAAPSPEREESPPPSAAYREEQSIVQDALTRLQAKVEEEIGESDPDARYNLGIAYKEMGLLDEAIGEFDLARRKPQLLLGASSLLADTLAAKGDFDAALETLSGLVSSGTLSEAEIRGVRYHKAVLLSRAGREDAAMEVFLAIYEEAPGYRDVASRTERFRR